MGEIVLKAERRLKKKTGYLPGVVYGKNFSSTPVNFDFNKVKKLLNIAGEKAKIQLDFENKKFYGVIKEVQWDLLNKEKPIHMDVHVVPKDEIINLDVPIIFTGIEELHQKRLILQTFKTEIEVKGKLEDIPEKIIVDVSDKQKGDFIKVKDLPISANITLKNSTEEIIGEILEVDNNLDENTDTINEGNPE
ncbi:50S ribosomal protein L25 [Anaerobranca gottschalkii]|uniref:Large subunit ribosomal protein L25 n=1 Tax=Anaerobranca gottschalkii DSM 13577 TaxID=1120990 RepID=A0A1I0B713_9FIRM|nr:50S ribosomal protein L25 [Anaerobranca gottschalkii]SET02527.1 large subunit ribosomal protein L25 [Anaerobranca gottschalkii DSM 13577]